MRWLDAAQDCEDGIPLAYLSGLHSCYGNFLELMMRTTAKVLPIPWSVFGNSTVIAEHIASLPAPTMSGWVGDIDRVLAMYVLL